MARLTDYRVLTFDCYGTLIDWETGIWDALQPLIMLNDDGGRVRATETAGAAGGTRAAVHGGGADETRSAGEARTAARSPAAVVTRADALRAFAQCESRQEQATPGLRYPALLTRVHRSIAETLGLRTEPALDEAFGSSVPLWPAFPDTADALRVLKRHYRLVILSNVHHEGIAASNRKLGVAFDAIYTAEDIGSYKPADANFDYLLAHLESDLGLARSDVLHTAQSLHHDHVPAKRFGLANAWIDRQRLSAGGSWGATARVDPMPVTDFVFFSMGEMAEAVSAAA